MTRPAPARQPSLSAQAAPRCQRTFWRRELFESRNISRGWHTAQACLRPCARAIAPRSRCCGALPARLLPRGRSAGVRPAPRPARVRAPCGRRPWRWRCWAWGVGDMRAALLRPPTRRLGAARGGVILIAERGARPICRCARCGARGAVAVASLGAQPPARAPPSATWTRSTARWTAASRRAMRTSRRWSARCGHRPTPPPTCRRPAAAEAQTRTILFYHWNRRPTSQRCLALPIADRPRRRRCWHRQHRRRSDHFRWTRTAEVC